ncbi:dephospho-CoA kinase domain-containing protein-like [Diadema antillarum]|uniref:dephospho-CoA kinase domain-containing protein-like n=1 Tax=Diadema antillarum TaxID=105358 RepID=UPI003A859717
MFLVGLTGGIASGKSTVSSIFRELECVVLDADKIAREVVEPGKPAWKKIVNHFGESILLEDGTIDRPKLGAIIFADADKRRLLNRCTHPYIQRSMLWQILLSFCKGYSYVILDIPLLLEGSALKKYIKYVLVVFCDKDVQLQRLMKRNDLTREDALQRIHSQMPLEAKRDLADLVIDNNGSLADTRQAVLRVHQQLQSSYAHWLPRLALGGFLLVAGTALYSIYALYTNT